MWDLKKKIIWIVQKPDEVPNPLGFNKSKIQQSKKKRKLNLKRYLSKIQNKPQIMKKN